MGVWEKKDGKEKDGRNEDLPAPPQDARGGHDEAYLLHRAAIDEGRGIAGDEDENFGGVGEAVVADGEQVRMLVGR